jgi:hypothetical protein
MCSLNIIKDITDELSRAVENFPGNEDMLAALSEEVGELHKAMLEQKYEPHKGVTDVDIYREAVQVAVMAIRVAVEGDASFPYELPILESDC